MDVKNIVRLLSVLQKHSTVLALTTTQHRCLASSHHLQHSSPSHNNNKHIVTTTDIDGFELSSLGPRGILHPRPLVVLIGWLNAKKQHLHKYQEVYWGQGFDVLTMCVSLKDIVRPRTGIKNTARLLNVLQENEELSSRQVVVHGFSTGAFIYTQLQLMMLGRQGQQEETIHQPGKLGTRAADPSPPSRSSPSDLSCRLVGVVLDSPAYLEHMQHGMANAVTDSPTARTIVSRAWLLYLAAFPRSVAFHFRESHRVFHHNSLPTLVLYSPVDLISSAETTERYLEEWREKRFPVFACKFPDSPHVSHFRNYPDLYLAALTSFLRRLDLKAPQDVGRDGFND